MAKTLPKAIRLGVSACLLGEAVRYDAGHKLDSYVADTLGRYFELLPICPEVAVGLGVPREPIRLEGDPNHPRAVGVLTHSLDVTIRLEAFGRQTAQTIGPISGFILKSRSPSCGIEGVKVWRKALARPIGRGIFARELMSALPLLPVEEETGLADGKRRENFLERVFAFRRWQELEARGITPARLSQFHSAHKLILMAHSPAHYQALGALVANAGRRGLRALTAQYAQGFMAALAVKSTPCKHANVLHHLMGYLKKQLDREDKKELLEAIENVRREQAPVIVPVTLMKHHFRRHPNPYVEHQLYLNPSPEEMGARWDR